MFNLPSELYTIDSGVVTINYSSITRTEVENATSLSYNGNVFCSITKQDLSGNGTFAQPYVVHSTKGFLYLTNKSLSGIALNAKYINLACDVVLNDETFDKDGNPKGGDGVVYSWGKIASVTNLTFDGCGHYIFGLYINEPERTTGALFSETSTLEEIKNLKTKNSFVNAKSYVATISYMTKKLTNCLVENGFVKGNGSVGGVAVFASNVLNCINWAQVENSGTNGTAGVLARTRAGYDCHIINCQNYGNVVAKNEKEDSCRAGGIIGRPTDKFTVERCQNFGDISVDAQQVGGIVGYAWGANATIIDCDNYGDINGKYNAGGIIGGAIYQASCFISGCNNYGYVKVTNVSVGSIFGSTYSNKETTITVINCADYALGYNQPLLGSFSDCVCIIENCYALQNGTGSTIEAIIYMSMEGNAEVHIKNVFIEIVGAANAFYVMRKTTPESAVKSSIKNLYIKGERCYSNASILGVENIFTGAYQGIVVDMTNRKEIYGSDFSGFYIDYKTGKLGFKEWDGKGFFQGKVTEEWFVNNGYRKKEA